MYTHMSSSHGNDRGAVLSSVSGKREESKMEETPRHRESRLETGALMGTREAFHFQATTGTHPPPAGATARPTTYSPPEMVAAVGTAIDMLLSGSHTSSAGRRHTAGASYSCLQRANMPNVAAAVVDVFSIAAIRVRTTAAEKYLPLHCEHDNNSKDYNDMQY
jgi:hypothetical protein